MPQSHFFLSCAGYSTSHHHNEYVSDTLDVCYDCDSNRLSMYRVIQESKLELSAQTDDIGRLYAGLPFYTDSPYMSMEYLSSTRIPSPKLLGYHIIQGFVIRQPTPMVLPLNCLVDSIRYASTQQSSTSFEVALTFVACSLTSDMLLKDQDPYLNAWLREKGINYASESSFVSTLLEGTISNIQALENPKTGQPFIHFGLSLANYGIDIDVLAPDTKYIRSFSDGQTVCCAGALVAKIKSS